MNEQVAKSSLSMPRRQLIETMQQIHFGKIEIQLRDAEPLFDPPPRIVQEIKIGSQNDTRLSTRSDFLLKNQVLELFQHLERLRSGTIVIEVRYGLPTKLILQRS